MRFKADTVDRNTGLFKGSEIEPLPADGVGESGRVSRPPGAVADRTAPRRQAPPITMTIF
jgi:hypothetical protein